MEAPHLLRNQRYLRHRVPQFLPKAVLGIQENVRIRQEALASGFQEGVVSNRLRPNGETLRTLPRESPTFKPV